MKQAAVREIHETPSNGCQRGTAISIGRPGGFPATGCGATDCVGHARIEGVQVTHYQKNGVAARGANSTLDAFGNFIADDPSPIIASNGVEVLTGARGNVQFNNISGNECNLPGVCGSDPLVNDQASGVLVFQGDLGTVVKNNLIATNDIGIYTDDGILVANNNASQNRYESIFVDTDSVGATVRGNTTNTGNYGIYVNKASGNTFEFDSAHGNSVFDMYSTFATNNFHSNSCDTAFPSRQIWDCTSPPCQEGDGQGDFQGDNGNGNFQFDGDGCRDGDQDSVSSQNRGDGKDFNSTRIDSIQVDSLTNTIAITGIGTSNGAPVAFTLVAVETTLLTSGSVSFVFSDGFTNAGTLLNGSVLLH
jgi:hypothetical protein